MEQSRGDMVLNVYSTGLAVLAAIMVFVVTTGLIAGYSLPAFADDLGITIQTSRGGYADTQKLTSPITVVFLFILKITASFWTD